MSLNEAVASFLTAVAAAGRAWADVTAPARAVPAMAAAPASASTVTVVTEKNLRARAARAERWWIVESPDERMNEASPSHAKRRPSGEGVRAFMMTGGPILKAACYHLVTIEKRLVNPRYR
jgi:hypothetical protein